ncbi:putative outer membrane protein probably involved in nutrient binding [Polaribacter irgensii 23-P]|uniref:Putative outer membrane protein probably involved in nutrient binding n=1 Tax=Polaribacter irgensii 23-P TaxID=313594 RepID=A4C345_9FLAO|nr:TonB-dependent receptor [Polaribacter irgensii]EAR11516.1 putative outer membrane protein probably involved in nutrient binding [Polaribacter irgensii 23-P]
MRKILKGMLTLFLAFIVQLAIAQEKTVTGTISDSSGSLPGVSVLVKGTKVGSETDFSGKYSISAKKGDVLIFRYLGYKVVEKVIGNSNLVNVLLEQKIDSLDEVIVIAYGTTTKEAFTGSASVITTADLALRNVTSPIAAIEGKATGVQFTSASGQPGSSPGIIIRGVGTLNGSSDPLYIVDGMQYEGALNTINQNDIASLTILKGGASTSLYGARAANGVVLITTKSGVKGKTRVNISSQFGMVTRGVSAYDYVNPGEYYELMWEGYKNSLSGSDTAAQASAGIYSRLGYNPFNVPNDQIVGTDGQLNPNAKVIYKSLDWYDALDQVGARSNHSVSIASGGDNHKVFFSTSYLEEEGYVITSKFDRLTTRINADFDVNKWLSLGGSANISISESKGPPSRGGSIANPFGFAKNMGSIYPVYMNDLEGNLILDASGNPIYDVGEGDFSLNQGSRPNNPGRHAIAEAILNDELNRDNTYGFRYYAAFEIMEGLNLRLNYGRDINEGINKSYENPIVGDGQPTARYGETRFRRDVQNISQVLTYSKSFNDVHNFDLTLGHESYDRAFSSNNGLSTTETASGIYEFDNFAIPVRVGGSSTKKTVEGYFGRLNYNFDNKYYISGSARRDASSVFSTDARWGTFYSVGASWRLDQEDFIKNVPFVNRLKLRASYGQVGNDNLGNFFISQPVYTITSNAGAPALALSNLGNNELTWETVGSYDVALEFSLFNNFLEGSVEYYKKNSTDLLYNLPIPLSNGINTAPFNTGDIFNSGVELGLTGHLINNKDFKWDLTLQGSTFKNEITDLPDPFVSGSKRWEEGRSRYDFFIFQSAGVDPANGDALYFKYKDNEDGKRVPVLDAEGVHETTNDWQDAERAYADASTIPDILGSVSNNFSYKGFTLDLLFTYGIGGDFLDNGYSAMMHSGSFGDSYHPNALNAWKQPGDITDVPRLEVGNTEQVQTQSTRFLTDASFLALKNANIGYTFDETVSDKLGVKTLKLYVAGENLFLKSKRTGLDPQYNLAGTGSGNDYNPSRIITFGLNVSF